MRKNILLILLLSWGTALAKALPSKYVALIPYVQPAPDQGETNTCWFVASTGAMELLLNKRDRINHPKVNGKNDLSESFLIWQKDFRDKEVETDHFIQEMVVRFNYGEAIHNKYWPFKAYYPDKTDSMEVWNKHPDFDTLPRMKVPQLKSSLLFARGRKYAMNVLKLEDITTVKEALVTKQAPVIINYNEDGYWHVILIVGYDDRKPGTCYEIEKEDCNKRGSFYVRDSNGKKYETRAYNWFLLNANAAAVVELK